MLRNPDDQPQEFALDVKRVFDLPPGAPMKYTLRSPWAEHSKDEGIVVEAGKLVTIPLGPLEVRIFDANPEM